MAYARLTDLPTDILLLLPDWLHNIEDYTSLASTCRKLRQCMQCALPSTILRLAAAQENVFFRPSPYFLAAATARELGNWARASSEHERQLAHRIQGGIEGLLALSLKHCGLTMARIRELHLMRFSIVNPVSDMIDKCIGQQWYATPRFWDGGVDDAYTIRTEASESFFHLAIYGELFGPDFEAALDPSDEQQQQQQRSHSLAVVTRLQYVKYCIPDFSVLCEHDVSRPLALQGSEESFSRALDPHMTMPDKTHTLGMIWLLKSSRWRPHWDAMRARAGCTDFQEAVEDSWWEIREGEESSWRQRMWENVMICQGLEGLGMLRLELRDAWIDRVREWKEKIGRIERQPEVVRVGERMTHRYPFFLGDLGVYAYG